MYICEGQILQLSILSVRLFCLPAMDSSDNRRKGHRNISTVYLSSSCMKERVSLLPFLLLLSLQRTRATSRGAVGQVTGNEEKWNLSASSEHKLQSGLKLQWLDCAVCSVCAVWRVYVGLDRSSRWPANPRSQWPATFWLSPFRFFFFFTSSSTCFSQGHNFRSFFLPLT